MKTIILLCTLILMSCSSIPYATMLHFSDSKPVDFFNVDPKGILVKVSINSKVNFDPIDSVNLSASIEDKKGLRKLDFPLEVVSMITETAVDGFFSDSPAMDVYILKLAPKALANLEVIQQERVSGLKKRVGLTAGVSFSKGVKKGPNKSNNEVEIDDNTVLSVALKLSKQDDFITLIDNWQIKSDL